MDELTDFPMPTGPQRPWTAELALRFRTYTLFKTVGICAIMWVFFTGYFYLLRHPAHPVAIMPLTALDRLIPFQPQALAAYVSLWIYIGFAPGLLRNLGDILRYALWAVALCLTGLACFYAWPTAVPDPGLDVSAHAGFVLLRGVDTTGNACPSLHVASAIFTACWIEHVLRRLRVPVILRVLNGAWFAAITYSTLAIKQHVVIDALAGILLGSVFALLSLRHSPPDTCGGYPR